MIPWLEDERGMTWLRRAIVLLLLVGFLTFVVKGANRPKNPVITNRQAPAVDIQSGG